MFGPVVLQRCTQLWLLQLTVVVMAAAAVNADEMPPSLHDEVTSSPNDVRAYCEWESFSANCTGNDVTDSSRGSGGRVIVVRSARYGRMQVGRCVTQSYGQIGCSADVTAELARTCSGRTQCSVAVISLYVRRSCPKDFTSYLEASYECVAVSTALDDDACAAADDDVATMTSLSSSPLMLTSSSGLLASRLSPTGCPWTIRVEPFQQIVVTLTDFDVGAADMTSAAAVVHSSASADSCVEYAVIADVISSSVSDEDGGAQLNTSLCGGATAASGDRRSNEIVFRSRGHVIRIYVRPDRSFLLGYEAVGCSEVPVPSNAWSRRTGSQHAVVQCNSSTEAWFLTCRGTSWIGTVGNCSTMYRHSSGEADELWPAFGASQRFPIGVLIVVALGVAIGVVVGVLLLISVLTCMRHRKARRIRSRSNCTSIMPGYVISSTADSYYGDVTKKDGTSRDVITGPATIGGTDHSMLLQPLIGDTSVTSSVATVTSAAAAVARRNEGGAANRSVDDLLRSVEQPQQQRPTMTSSTRKSRASRSLVSLLPSSSSDSSSRTRQQTTPPLKYSCTDAAVQLRVDSRLHSPQQHHCFIVDSVSTETPRPAAETMPGVNIAKITGSLLPSSAWWWKPTSKSERRRIPTPATGEGIAENRILAMTPGYFGRQKYPLSSSSSGSLRRSRTCGMPGEMMVPTSWNPGSACSPQQYEVFFGPRGTAADRIYDKMELDHPDVVQNCALCRHAASDMATFSRSSDENGRRTLYHDDDERY